MTLKTMRTDLVRVWLIENRAGPENVPDYQSCWKAGSLAWPQGDTEIFRCPDPDQYGAFIVVDEIPGDKGDPSVTITSRYWMDLSTMLKILNRGCAVDLQMHMGQCKDPQDFNGGWQKILVVEGARMTDYGIANLGALGPDERSLVDEEVPFTGKTMYEIKAIIYQEKAEAEVNANVIDIEVCDAVSCGLCSDPSDGCEKIFALQTYWAGSPGLPAELVYSGDDGLTWGEDVINSLPLATNGDDMACVGRLMVIVSAQTNSLHWSVIADILANVSVWTEMGTGMGIVDGEPRAIYSVGPRHTWIVGDGGYIYFTENPVISVVVQDAGVVTDQDLKDVHAYDQLNVLAVGVDNTVVFTRNGGDTWALLVGPEPGATLYTCYMKGINEWWIGTNTGNLYYTKDGGTTWEQKEFYGDGEANSVITDIEWSTPSVGWFAQYRLNVHSRIYRTIDGGYSWYVTPEGNTALPGTKVGLNKLAVCSHDPNLVWAAGVEQDTLDGFIAKGS